MSLAWTSPRPCLTLAVALGATALAGCETNDPDAPPTLRLGRDLCAECGMSIVDGRHAAATIAGVDGEPTTLHWDDIGCMLDWERANGSASVMRRWVRVDDDSQWARADQASYAMGTAIRTPMGSQIAACRDETQARATVGSQPGVVLSFGELAAARISWLRSKGRLPPVDPESGGG